MNIVVRIDGLGRGGASGKLEELQRRVGVAAADRASRSAQSAAPRTRRESAGKPSKE